MRGTEGDAQRSLLQATVADHAAPGPVTSSSNILHLPLHHAEIVFGPFRLFPETRELFHGATAIAIGSRALDILIMLAKRPGATIGTDELMAGIWSGIHVESTTLRVHIGALRKTLNGRDCRHNYIVNVTGRGYALVPPRPGKDVLPPHKDGPATRRRLLEINAARLFGRATLMVQITRQLRTQRLVTLVGPGGVGKSALATQVTALAARNAQEVAYIDFSPLDGDDLLTTHIATRLGLPSNNLDSTATILRYLSDKPMLLVLDTCEHVIAEAARFAAAVLAGAPQVHVLATSREALRVAGEHVRLVRGLTVADSDDVTLAKILASPAGQLFADRAVDASADMSFQEEDAHPIADICRRLDGLPLAIELAAALAPHMGVRGLARALTDRFALLTNGYRTAVSRHHTLRATVDWSYRLLTEREQTVFRRFGIFSDAVTWEHAVALLPLHDLDGAVVADALHALAAKSLIEMTPCGDTVRCRMLDTNREFARMKLAACGELDAMARHHSGHWAGWLESWSPEMMEHAEGRQDCETVLANVRSALTWCWVGGERRKLGVRLTLAAVPLWANLSLVAETIGNVNRALDSDDPGKRDRMRLHAALGGAMMNIEGGGERMEAAWATVLDLAEEESDLSARLQALWGLWVGRRNQGNAGDALRIAETYAALAEETSSPLFSALADRMLGVSYFFVGRLTEARTCIERMLTRSRPVTRRAQIAALQFDQTIAARCFQAQILWMQGFPDQASAVAAQNVEDAVATDHAGSLSYALSEGACPIALHNGDYDGMSRFVALLLTRTKGQGLEVWHTLGRCFESLLLLRHGDRGNGLRQLEEVLGELRSIHHGPIYSLALGEYALALADAGRSGEATPIMEEAFARLQRNGELWCLAELKRIRAELAARGGAVKEARRWFTEALAVSRQQGAVAWELRAATGLARLDPGEDAAEVLAAVLSRYLEGHRTRDVMAAVAVLQALK